LNYEAATGRRLSRAEPIAVVVVVVVLVFVVVVLMELWMSAFRVILFLGFCVILFQQYC
jgi:Flp pilus assembly protein TadB